MGDPVRRPGVRRGQPHQINPRRRWCSWRLDGDLSHDFKSMYRTLLARPERGREGLVRTVPVEDGGVGMLGIPARNTALSSPPIGRVFSSVFSSVHTTLR
jgi:hypothetical protein